MLCAADAARDALRAGDRARAAAAIARMHLAPANCGPFVEAAVRGGALDCVRMLDTEGMRGDFGGVAAALDALTSTTRRALLGAVREPGRVAAAAAVDGLPRLLREAARRADFGAALVALLRDHPEHAVEGARRLYTAFRPDAAALARAEAAARAGAREGARARAFAVLHAQLPARLQEAYPSCPDAVVPDFFGEDLRAC